MSAKRMFAYIRDEDEIVDWVVIHGYLLNTSSGGGFEVFGPFTKYEADLYRKKIKSPEATTIAVQLLRGR